MPDGRVESEEAPLETDPRAPKFHSRREVVRRGVKLAFMAPVISTFFAADAQAAGSNHSCYPTGQACNGASEEGCCDGACSGGVCP